MKFETEVLPASGETEMSGLPATLSQSFKNVRCMFCGGRKFIGRNWEATVGHFVPFRPGGISEQIGGTKYKIAFDCVGCRVRYTVEKEI